MGLWGKGGVGCAPEHAVLMLLLCCSLKKELPLFLPALDH